MAITTNKSKYLSDALLNWETGSAMPTALSNMYVALLTTMPTNNAGAGLVEVTGGSYARQALASANWGSITTAGDNVTEQVSSSVPVSFPQASANWGNIVGIALYDAVTNGNLLYFGAITAITINSGNQLAFASGQITRTEN